MNLILTRLAFCESGIFGELSSQDKSICVGVTLEHAFACQDGSFAPIIPPGSYTCVRGQHQLLGMTEPFTTFEITDVAGHTNLLFHVGNFNKDSEGCVLLGSERVGDMIQRSAIDFDTFMALQKGVDTFILVVVE